MGQGAEPLVLGDFWYFSLNNAFFRHIYVKFVRHIYVNLRENTSVRTYTAWGYINKLCSNLCF